MEWKEERKELMEKTENGVRSNCEREGKELGKE